MNQEVGGLNALHLLHLHLFKGLAGLQRLQCLAMGQNDGPTRVRTLVFFFVDRVRSAFSTFPMERCFRKVGPMLRCVVLADNEGDVNTGIAFPLLHALALLFLTLTPAIEGYKDVCKIMFEAIKQESKEKHRDVMKLKISE